MHLQKKNTQKDKRMIKVLFVCIHNSARSQMAEELLRKYGGENFSVQSAGLEPGIVNPLAVEILKEEGIDIKGKQTQSVFELFKDGKLFHYVVTVCDEAIANDVLFSQVKRVVFIGVLKTQSVYGNIWREFSANQSGQRRD